ncbi:hypothetical protein ELI02_00115 [Rhizobium leguminosarum]|uniref:Uncharacterized protein n=1 Tax=Rhizobium leguminosarum TaxID=384 RepID=A0A4Q8Y2G2_RHILE|nr:hypothetical protein ELI41_00110 [Rhizobium leguminosarum]TAV51632.1 hypothetical protein ELI29_00110 [Rhizobium leguminosarum]TAX53785.1 hypothetical protein ELI01_00115 [Rhizobium leguminosarum]TAX58542.1 hypothetical protein ELI02_00115 [Rhizobium leguminosarum]TAX70254.1 hypothetical protein ELI03_00110 [Rhizobium leguminosarum]
MARYLVVFAARENRNLLLEPFLVRLQHSAGHLSARAEAVGSDVPKGMPFANRLCPDKNLLRQNAAI